MMKPFTKQKLLSYFIIALLILGCIKKKEPDIVIPDPDLNKCTSASPVRKVLIIGVDGVRTDALLAASSPGFDSLIAHSYVNLNCDRGPYTLSGPGWSTILHGVLPAKHGVTSNTFPTTNYAQYPDLFYYLRRHNAYLNLSSIHRWQSMDSILLNTTLSEYCITDYQAKEKVLYLLNSCPPDVLFLHLENVDSRGHFSGFSPTNPDYINAIREAGNHTEEIMNTVKLREQNNGEEWLVFVVTDHGGKNYDHGNQDTLPETRFVFQIARLPNMSRINLPVANNTNVMPTILKYMGVPIDSTWGLDGVPIF